jgi:DNA-binding MarR family transcriptional regulator
MVCPGTADPGLYSFRLAMSDAWRYVNAVQAVDKSETDLSILEVSVLMHIALRMGKNDAAWPSQIRLAKETGATERGIGKALANLLEMGLISCRSRNRRTNVYTIDTEAIDLLAKIDVPEHSSVLGGTEFYPDQNTVPVRPEPSSSKH